MWQRGEEEKGYETYNKNQANCHNAYLNFLMLGNLNLDVTKLGIAAKLFQSVKQT